MVKKEILITYKRRRFFKDSKPANKASDISEDSRQCNDLLKPKVCLLPSKEIKDPYMMVTLDKAAEHSKEKYKFPLITFTRRAKRKREATENIVDSNTEIENKQCAQESESELCSLSGQSQLFDHDEAGQVVVVAKNSEINPIPFDQATKQAGQTSNEDQSSIPTEKSISNMETNCAGACNMDSSKLLINVNPGNFVESQSSSSLNPPIALNKNSDEARKELEWLDDMDRILQERKKKVHFCSRIKQSGINCKEGESPGFNSHVIPLQEQAQSSGFSSLALPLLERGQSSGFNSHVVQLQEHGSQVIALQEQPLLAKLDVPLPEMHLPEETSSISSHYRNFLGSISGNQCKSPPLSTERPIYHRQMHIKDYNITGNLRSKESSRSTNNMLGMYSNEWSEEELDYLWIGIRRHGVNNWNAILHDPKLHFLISRVPEDLAMQWKIEHRKFLNHDGGYSSFPTMDNAAAWRSKAANQSAVETNLSLGDVYHQRRNIFSSYRNDYSRYLQMPMRSQNATYTQTCEKFMHDYNYMGGFPNSLNDTRNGMNLLNSEMGIGMHFPYAEASSSKKSRRRDFMNRKNRCLFRENNNVGVRVNEASVSPNDAWKVKASKTHPVDNGILENSSISMRRGAVESKGLVIVDGRATSEDTISE